MGGDLLQPREERTAGEGVEKRVRAPEGDDPLARGKCRIEAPLEICCGRGETVLEIRVEIEKLEDPVHGRAHGRRGPGAGHRRRFAAVVFPSLVYGTPFAHAFQLGLVRRRRNGGAQRALARRGSIRPAGCERLGHAGDGFRIVQRLSRAAPVGRRLGEERWETPANPSGVDVLAGVRCDALHLVHEVRTTAFPVREQCHVALRTARARHFRVNTREHQPAARARSGDIERAHPLRARDAGMAHLDRVVAERARAEELDFQLPLDLLGARARLRALPSVELQHVDVVEVEPLRLVDRHHLDRVLDRLARAAFFRLTTLRHVFAQIAQHRLGVPLAVAQRPREIAKEAVEVRQAIRPRVAGGFGHFEEEEAAQLLDEDIRRIGLESGPQRPERASCVEQVVRPARDPCDPRNVAGNLRLCLCHEHGEGGEAFGIVPVQFRHAPGQLARPERHERRVRHPHHRRPKQRQQRQLVVRIEYAANQRTRLDNLAAREVASIPLHGERHFCPAQRRETGLDGSPRAEEQANSAPGRAGGVECGHVGGERGGFQRVSLGNTRLARLLHVPIPTP